MFRFVCEAFRQQISTFSLSLSISLSLSRFPRMREKKKGCRSFEKSFYIETNLFWSIKSGINSNCSPVRLFNCSQLFVCSIDCFVYRTRADYIGYYLTHAIATESHFLQSDGKSWWTRNIHFFILTLKISLLYISPSSFDFKNRAFLHFMAKIIEQQFLIPPLPPSTSPGAHPDSPKTHSASQKALSQKPEQTNNQ